MDRVYTGTARQALVKGLVAIAIVLSIPAAHRKLCGGGARREASLAEVKRQIDLDLNPENFNQREQMSFYRVTGEVFDSSNLSIPCHKKRENYLREVKGLVYDERIGKYVFDQ